MNSVKTALVSLVLLGVLYGMYQVLNAPPAQFDADGYPEEAPSAPMIDEGVEFDPSTLGLASTDSVEMEVQAPGAAPPLVQDNGIADAGGESNSNMPGAGFTSNTQPSSWSTDTSSSPDGPGVPPIPSGPIADVNRSQHPNDGSNSDEAPAFGTGSFRATDSPSLNPSNAYETLAQQGATAPNTDGSTVPTRGQNAGVTAAVQRATSQDEITDAAFTGELSQAWTDAESLIQDEQFAEVLKKLSYFYGDERLTREEQENLLTWLDALAAKVIYSTEFHQEGPYRVQDGETLDSIADHLGVPRELLFNINQGRLSSLNSPPAVGQELKIVRGPFNGELNLQQGTLTLFKGELYAGRFAIQLGPGTKLPPGDYQVVFRSEEGKDWIRPDGTQVAALAANNPYASYVLELENGTVIHENRAVDPNVNAPGIGCSAADIYDIYSILSVGSILQVQP